MSIKIIKGTLKYRQVYICASCGKHEDGVTQTVEIDESNYINFHEHLTPNCHGMPYGWTSFYAPKKDYFVCPCGGSK